MIISFVCVTCMFPLLYVSAASVVLIVCVSYSSVCCFFFIRYTYYRCLSFKVCKVCKKVFSDRTGLILASKQRWKNLDPITELICLSNFRELSNSTPKFCTWEKKVYIYPRSIMLIPEEIEGPKTITGFICIQKRTFLESQHLTSFKLWFLLPFIRVWPCIELE